MIIRGIGVASIQGLYSECISGGVVYWVKGVFADEGQPDELLNLAAMEILNRIA